MYRALVSPKQPACSSSGNVLLMVAIVPASCSLWHDKEYNALPTADRLVRLPAIHSQIHDHHGNILFFLKMIGS